MANWKEIQGRIRRAQKTENPSIALAALYQKTHDAMVAFELARHFERAGNASAAGQWYSTAAQGFRRPQWKAKAEEAMARLGVTPAEHAVAAAVPAEEGIAEAPFTTEMTRAIDAMAARPEEQQPRAEEAAPVERAGASAGAPPGGKRRRRGRRGGRRHRGGRTAAGQSAIPARPLSRRREHAEEPLEDERAAAAAAAAQTSEAGIHEEPSGARWKAAGPAAHVEVVEREAPPSVRERGRAGDPGLSSRIALLESQLRRMLAGSPTGVDEADRAPAGPGVFLLSDTDLQTHYYVEACQTLRIGIGNLLRTGRQAAGRGAAGPALRARLAKHLGISETKAAKYLSDHCAVRWLQLDDGANLLAHFAIAVLRPALNE